LHRDRARRAKSNTHARSRHRALGPIADPYRKNPTQAVDMTILLLLVALVWGAATLYFAVKSRDFRKFLAGAFFVSAGIQLYLYLADVSVPILGTNLVQTPRISALRAVPHSIFFLLTLYFGFLRKPKDST
jgi:hypothetical protein